jgi:choline trimethylamine-lyase
MEIIQIQTYPSTERVQDLRRRVRSAMEQPPVGWKYPARIDDKYMSEPIPVRKARAVSLKLSQMPTDLWDGQLFAGSMTLENPRIHAEWGFPDYVTDEERNKASKKGVSIHSVFGHIVPDYPKLLSKGLLGIIADVNDQRPRVQNDDESDFLDSVVVVLGGVMNYASRLAERCEAEAENMADLIRADELKLMANNLYHVPAGPAQTFWQALQSVWLLHEIFHSTMDGNAMGRLDQYCWQYLENDLESGRLDMEKAQELVECFTLKFNERAKTTDDQRPETRKTEQPNLTRRSRHYTSSQIGNQRDGLDATNHWLQNIVISGLTPDGEDGTNPLSFLLLESYRRNQMTNPLLTVRVHQNSPDELLHHVCEVLKDGGGMPAIFNDEAIIPALERLGIPSFDAYDYTNDGCWEIIIPGRTDFRFQRLSVMLCIEWGLNRGKSRLDDNQSGPETGDPREFKSFDDVWQAFQIQLDAMIERVVHRVVENINDRSIIAPVPLLSALIEGAISSRRDMTAGGAKFRTYGMLAEGAAHAIDSLTAIKTVIFDEKQATISELCDALDANFDGHAVLRSKLLSAPKYGNDDDRADSVGRQMIDAFTKTVAKYAEAYKDVIKFPSGVGTFSWYIGIGEGLATSPDGRLSGEPVSSNFSPALGRDLEGLPGAILSYSKMHDSNLPAGSPLDLRLAKRLVQGEDGTDRMMALIRSFVDTGGNMMTLTVADTEELRSAQREPEKYKSLRVRMGGWCAYFTMLSKEQQEHHIRRQESKS